MNMFSKYGILILSTLGQIVHRIILSNLFVENEKKIDCSLYSIT